MTTAKQDFEEDFRTLYEYAPCGYLSFRLDGTIVAVNQTLLDLIDYAKDELVSRMKFQDLLTLPGRIFYETQFHPLLQMQGFVNEIALDLVPKRGSILNVFVTSTLQSPPSPSIPFVRTVIFVATDRRQYERELVNARLTLQDKVRDRTSELEREISERKKAEQGLKELTSKLLRLRDEERRRLARDLHDSAGQLLSIAAINLGTVARADLSDTARKSLSDATEMVRETLKEIRVVSYLLHPPLLDESGLESALKWFVEGFAGRADIEVDLQVEENLGRFSQDMEIAIFRIAQECLTNVHRHSGAKSATVCLSKIGNEVCVEVRDSGNGISQDKPQGVGLRGMTERVSQFGGSIEIKSSDRGTAIIAKFPANG